MLYIIIGFLIFVLLGEYIYWSHLYKKCKQDWAADVLDLGIAWRYYLKDNTDLDWRIDIPCRRRLIETINK